MVRPLALSDEGLRMLIDLMRPLSPEARAEDISSKIIKWAAFADDRSSARHPGSKEGRIPTLV